MGLGARSFLGGGGGSPESTRAGGREDSKGGKGRGALSDGDPARDSGLLCRVTNPSQLFSF